MQPNQHFRLTKQALIAVGVLVFGFVGVLCTAYTYDEATNRANSSRYEEYKSRIAVGMTKSQIISRIGYPVDVNEGKDNEELWWWQSNHRYEHTLIYSVVGKPAYHGVPYLRLAFDNSGRVATVEISRPWR